MFLKKFLELFYRSFGMNCLRMLALSDKWLLILNMFEMNKCRLLQNKIPTFSDLQFLSIIIIIIIIIIINPLPSPLTINPFSYPGLKLSIFHNSGASVSFFHLRHTRAHFRTSFGGRKENKANIHLSVSSSIVWKGFKWWFIIIISIIGFF